MIRGRMALCAVLLIAAAAPAALAANEDAFARGNRAYQDGDFAAAVTAYESLIHAGAHGADLYYNLGNAYFRGGKIGFAIYNYERALAASPGMEDARYNLDLARRVVARRAGARASEPPPEPGLVRLARRPSLGQLFVAILIFEGLVFGLLIGLRFIALGPLRTALASISGFLGLSLLVVALWALAQLVWLGAPDTAIVLPDTVAMREGPSPTVADKGQLFAGTEVKVIARKGPWLKVRLENGGEGWLPAAALGQL